MQQVGKPYFRNDFECFFDNWSTVAEGELTVGFKYGFQDFNQERDTDGVDNVGHGQIKKELPAAFLEGFIEFRSDGFSTEIVDVSVRAENPQGVMPS